MARRVFFTDFDGTITDLDFFELVMQRMDPQLDGDPVGEFYAGRLSLFDALHAVFAAIRVSEREVLDLLPEVAPDPAFADDLVQLHDAGWEIHVISAGSDWYIHRLFEQIGVRTPVAVHANPGRFIEGEGLRIERPADPRIARQEIGIDKAEVVRIHAEGAQAFGFAGNSRPDLPAARITPEPLRFARGSLCPALDELGLGYQRFERWSQVAAALLGGS